VPTEDAFAAVTRHDGFRDAVARGAIVARRIPTLDGEVMRRLRRSAWTLGWRAMGGWSVRDVPTDQRQGRGMVRRWLKRMETAFRADRDLDAVSASRRPDGRISSPAGAGRTEGWMMSENRNVSWSPRHG
jgi:hypothetical protein